MDYEIICRRIRLQIDAYEDRQGIMPNRIILGKTIYDIVRYCNSLVNFKKPQAKKMYGIDITVDTERLNIIAVGYMYMEEANHEGL